MTRFRKHRFLLFVVALLFAVGHSHQMFGQFHAHHHGFGAAVAEHDHHDWDHHGDAGDEEKEAKHMAEHEVFVAVVSTFIIPVILELCPLSKVTVDSARLPESRVTGIDHPPQLV